MKKGVEKKWVVIVWRLFFPSKTIAEMFQATKMLIFNDYFF